MTYNLLLARSLRNDVIAAALARCLHVRAQDVDVADDDTDEDRRNWDALVLCEKTAIFGELSSSLDIYVQESVQPQPQEDALAARFAQEVQAVVLYPAAEALPSAYWLATPDGVVTRARLYTSDDEVPQYTIDAVESPVAQLPHTPVTRIAEVVREQKVGTPLTDSFTGYLRHVAAEEADTPGTLHWSAHTRLGAWEKFVRQMEAGWAPFGWYPPDLYRERLESRDELEQIKGRLPESIASLAREVLEQLDARFAGMTVEDTGALRKELTRSQSHATPPGWWWNRRPDPLPW